MYGLPFPVPSEMLILPAGVLAGVWHPFPALWDGVGVDISLVVVLRATN